MKKTHAFNVVPMGIGTYRSPIKSGMTAILVLVFFLLFLATPATVFAASTAEDGSEGQGAGSEVPAASEEPGEQPPLKIYYTEPIGGGEKVYQMRGCVKKEAYAPIRCSEEAVQFSSKQCKPGGKLVPGTFIKGCIEPGIKDPYTQVTQNGVDRYDGNVGKCKDNPDNIGFFYGPEWAIISEEDATKDAWMIVTKGSIAWPNQEIPPTLVRKFVPNGHTKKLYRTTECFTWDVLPDQVGTDAGEQPVGQITGTARATFNKLRAPARKLIGNNGEFCNNDNSRPINGIEKEFVSTPFDNHDYFQCSVVERITGRSGSELFGRYISALYRWASGLVGIVAVLVMVVSGIQISMAGGDTGKIDEAKNRIMTSLAAIAILFLSGLILYTINPGFFTG